MHPFKRRWPLRDDFLDELDRELEEMERNMGRLFEDLRKNSIENPGEGMPYVYGFSMRVGPDGKPHIEEFGNVPSDEVSAGEISTEREPLTDVIGRDKEISVIAELPGIEKKDIELSATEDTLNIRVDAPGRKYHKNLMLPARVKADTTKASYKNGVLEVRLKRAEPKREDEVKVRIE